jgi:hypothetical protein
VNESASVVSAWESFYVIVGSSGGALIGLQFVVVTLIAERRGHAVAGSLSAFGTPTVVHFAGALLLSAFMSVPWPSLIALSVTLVMCGLGGLTYAAIVIRRARRQTDYKPVAEDWIWHTILPCACYAALTVSAVLLRTNEQLALFVIAAVALGLLLIGIHNSWDAVTHIVISNAGDETKNPP